MFADLVLPRMKNRPSENTGCLKAPPNLFTFFFQYIRHFSLVGTTRLYFMNLYTSPPYLQDCELAYI